MNASSKFLYSPALRMKAGELEGVRLLAPDVASVVLPRFIVPPRSERDPKQLTLLEEGELPEIGAVLAKNWLRRPALIDCTYILDEYGRERLSAWLPQMFERARRRDVYAIPLALLTDLGETETPAFRASIAVDEPLKIAIRIPFGEIEGPEFETSLKEALNRLGVAPSDCAVIADFADADFSDPRIVAPIIAGALERIQDIGQWHWIIFQGTNYPEKNPAGHGGKEFWPRNEWKAWCLAVRFDPSTADHMIFGDYAADCAKMEFGKSTGAQAIRHLRYTAGANWIVQRGAEKGTDKERMKAVCKAIFESGDFAGADFSAADSFIYRLAMGLGGPGNATTWRQLNTNHHITRVIADVGAVRGLEIKKAAPVVLETQFMLLDTK